jgi:hypothetical protein
MYTTQQDTTHEDYMCMYKGWATKISSCTMTFEDLLCLKSILAELFNSNFNLKQRKYSLKSELNEINVRFECSPQIYLNNI